MEGMLTPVLFRVWILPSGLPDQWPLPHSSLPILTHPLLPPLWEACLGLLPQTQLLLTGVTLTLPGPLALGRPCWQSSVLGPGMHGVLITELSTVPGALAVGDSTPLLCLLQLLTHSPSALWERWASPSGLAAAFFSACLDHFFLRTPA